MQAGPEVQYKSPGQQSGRESALIGKNLSDIHLRSQPGYPILFFLITHGVFPPESLVELFEAQ